MYIRALVNITHRAWALPILAHMHQGVAGRQAALLSATGAGRTAFAQSMEHLITLGLVERNPGHGHPLRPEFRLTPNGAAAATLASKVQQAAGSEGQDLLRRSWTLPVLASLEAPSHFTSIKRNLVTITDRALSQSLRTLEEREWVVRSVESATRPPKPLYRAINTGEIISRVTGSEMTGWHS